MGCFVWQLEEVEDWRSVFRGIGQFLIHFYVPERQVIYEVVCFFFLECAEQGVRSEKGKS